MCKCLYTHSKCRCCDLFCYVEWRWRWRSRCPRSMNMWWSVGSPNDSASSMRITWPGPSEEYKFSFSVLYMYMYVKVPQHTSTAWYYLTHVSAVPGTVWFSLLTVFEPHLYMLCRTKETLSSGNYLSIINVLMQLRKVHVYTYIITYTCTYTFTCTLYKCMYSSRTLLMCIPCLCGVIHVYTCSCWNGIAPLCYVHMYM